MIQIIFSLLCKISYLSNAHFATPLIRDIKTVFRQSMTTDQSPDPFLYNLRNLPSQEQSFMFNTMNCFYQIFVELEQTFHVTMAICRWKSLTLDYSLDLELYLYGALHPFFFKNCLSRKENSHQLSLFCHQTEFLPGFYA